MSGLIGQLIFGLIIGIIARAVLPGKENITPGPIGWLITAAIGVGGAFLGTLVKSMFFGAESGAAGWILSALGAIVLLVAYRMIFGRGQAS